MNESAIRNFWNTHPCGEQGVGGIGEHNSDYKEFFSSYDAYRYKKEAHIPECLDGINFAGKTVLEIGLGQGADSEQIVRRGGIWSGLDLTSESVERVQTRFSLSKLPYEEIKQGSILEAPFDDDSFDIVFSHGVLHHVPDIHAAQKEIHRILKPGGELVVMLYARWSWKYVVHIGIALRLAVLASYLGVRKPGKYTAPQLENSRSMGMFNYLKMSNFIHANTDGPQNPYSKVYDVRTVKNDFPEFEVVRSYKRLVKSSPPEPRLPVDRLLGFHLWVHMRAR